MGKFVIAFILIIFVLNNVNSTKLNYPRILLPIFDKITINFTLEVIEKGCVKWTSSRLDLIQITPLYDNSDYECTSRATISVLTRDRRRSTAIVLAEDMNGGDVLRCDVILDVIYKLGVLTTTRELFLEEAPETFELWAQDSQGNAFTTLEGVEFNWQISQAPSRKGNQNSNWQQVLRFLTFTESKYHEVPPSLKKFESAGIKGYMILFEAINTGTARVTVRMPYPEYKIVSLIEVDIMVLANIILDPIDVHVLVGDTVNFRVLQLKQGKLQEIALKTQYYLEIEDEDYALLEDRTVTGLKLGKTKVILRDRNVPSDGGDSMKSPVPTATLTVSAPHKIAINLLPHYNWLTVVGEKHEIAIDLYTSDDQKILLGPKYLIDSQFDSNIYRLIKKTVNGSRIYGEAIKAGSSPVLGSFNKLSAKAELHVFPDLTLSPRRVILPFDPNVIKSQKVQFNAKGGDGSYIWSSQSPNYLQISGTGLAETTLDFDGRNQGDSFDDHLKAQITKHTNIKVALSRNTKIFRQAEIYFLPPVKLEIVKYNFETSLKDYVKLHIAVYAFVNNTYIPFTKCDNLNFDFEFSNQIFQLESGNGKDMGKDDLMENACHLAYLRSSSVGTTNLKISYRFMDKVLHDEAVLWVFEKLTILNPIGNEVVLPIGAKRNLIYTNGPQKIFNLDSELLKDVSNNPKIAKVTEINLDTSKAIHAFEVLCLEIGETQLNFEIYNSMVMPNFEAYISSFTTKIYCVKPRFINLYATEELRQSCPMEMVNSLVHVTERDENLVIQVEVLDSKNRKLMNISSLAIDWEFAQGDQKYQKDISYYRDSENEDIEGILIPGKDLLVTSLNEIVHNFKIKGIVTKYDLSVLNRNNIYPENPQFGILKSKTGQYVTPIIENEINFMAVNSTLFPYESTSIYLAQNRAERIKISQGSGYYTFELTDPSIISVEYDTKSRELIIVPHKIGHVIIDLIDRCLMSEPARLSVSVVSIGSIAVEVMDRVEKTKTIEAIVKLYDSNENLLTIDSRNLDIYNIVDDIFNSNILNVKLAEQNNLNPGEIRYLVTGTELGETKIMFMSGLDDRQISSEPANIQVFPPLRLQPRNSTLIVGSSVQIYYHGGPHPDVNIVYSVHNKNIASMDSAIVQARKLGDTKITGKCIGVNPATGKQIVFSEDTIEVFVVPLEKILIRTPLVRIKSGAVMPASVWGVPELSPMILGTLENMKIIWSTNHPDVVDIFGVFSEAGVEYNDDDLISVRVKGMNPGKAKIHATMTLPGGQKLTTGVEVTVFKILELESPKPITMDSILLAPRSTIQLKANLDDVVYKLETDAPAANCIVRVSSDGIVRSGETLGRDLIIARTFEQNLPIGIEVKNVQYILASLEYPSVKLKQTEEKIPRGMNMVLKVSLHDNLGNEFSHNIEDVNGIKYDLSHKDMLDIQIGNNLTVALNLRRETNNMLLIALKDSTGVKYAEDYIKVSVAESKYLYPTKKLLSVGDIICFDSPLTLATYWTSSDERILSIDRYTGIGKVLGNRHKTGDKVIITNGDKTGSYVKYELEIREADKIEFTKSYDIFSTLQYKGYLVITNHMQLEKSSNLIARNVSKCSSFIERPTSIKYFTCRMISKQQPGILVLANYKVTPYFDKEHGSYACLIDLVTSLSAVMNVMKAQDVIIELEAQLPNGISDSVTLKIVPGIKVSPDAISVDQITQQGIIITGLDKVLQKIEVKTSDASILEVIPQAKAHGSLQFKLKLLNELPSDVQLFVHIHSPLTVQDIQIPIQGINANLQTCSSLPFNNSSAFLIKIISNLGLIMSTLIFMSAVVWVALFGLPGRNQTKINTQAFSGSFRNQSNASNNSNSGLSILEQSQLNASSTPRGPNYPSQIYVLDQSGTSFSSENDSVAYGDSSIISTQRRLHRRNF